MTEILEGQVSLFGADTPSTKTSPELSAATAGATSKPSSRRSQGSQSRTLQTFLCLKRADGLTQEPSMAWEETGSPFPWLGACTTRSTGVYLKGGKDSVYWETSTDLQRLGFCLTLNLSERPKVANPTKLSQILERNPDPKYRLSERACQGILNRAERRGKELPPELREALEIQSGNRNASVSTERESETSDDGESGIARYVSKATGLTEQIPQAATDADGDAANPTRSTPLTAPPSYRSKNGRGSQGGAKGYSSSMNTLDACPRSTSSPSSRPEPILLESNQNHATIQTDGISTALPASMGMGGGYVPMITETAQSGVDLYNGSVTGDVAATLSSESCVTNSRNGPYVMAAGFSFGQSAKARSLGYEEEKSPTIRGGEGGNQKPHVLVTEREDDGG